MHACLHVGTQTCRHAHLSIFCIFALPRTTRTRRGDTGHPFIDLKGKILLLSPVFVMGVR